MIFKPIFTVNFIDFEFIWPRLIYLSLSLSNF